jgi:hypothetical protein
MISAIAINADTVTVKIGGDDFEEDLLRFKNDIPFAHRQFDGQKFIVRRAKQVKVKYIQAALKDYEKQLKLL